MEHPPPAHQYNYLKYVTGILNCLLLGEGPDSFVQENGIFLLQKQKNEIWLSCKNITCLFCEKKILVVCKIQVAFFCKTKIQFVCKNKISLFCLLVCLFVLGP